MLRHSAIVKYLPDACAPWVSLGLLASCLLPMVKPGWADVVPGQVNTWDDPALQVNLSCDEMSLVGLFCA